MSTLATRIGKEIKTVRTEVGPLATELEMQEGMSTDVKRLTPALVKAAIEANGPSSVLHVDYDNRDDLRNLTPEDKEMALVEGLGLFVFYLGSDELDDDETSFATATGRWLIEAVGWEAVYAWTLMREDEQDSRLNTAENRLDNVESGTNRIFTTTVNNSITAVTSAAQVSFTATMADAAIGDSVVVTPPTALIGRLAIYGRVTAPDTVTIYINNPSAATASFTNGTWTILVVKEI